MPLFICDCCGAVDNTACGGTWHKNRYDSKGTEVDKNVPDLCCKCATGKWHDKFVYELCTADIFLSEGEDNFMYDFYECIKQSGFNTGFNTLHLEIRKDKSIKSKTQLKKLKRGCKKKK